MSYSSGGSGRSFGNRGSAQKKDKKRKQDFHKHHLKFTPEEHHSLEELKDRVSIGLQRLGTQVFSSEPGGYGFHNWMTSFNMLLDDFEDKCRPATLPKEYYDSRLSLTAKLLEPVDTSTQDLQVKELEQDIGLAEEKIAEIVEKSERAAVEEYNKDEAKIGRLKRERTETELGITKVTEELEEEKKKAAAQSLFKRLFSNSELLKAKQAKLDSMTVKKEELDEEIHALEEDRSKRQGEVKKYDTEISALRANLDDLRIKLGEVETQKQEALQISERRSEITKSMAEMISSLQLGSAPEKPEATSE